MTQPLCQLENPDAFIHRHIGPDSLAQQTMLEQIGATDLAEFIASIVPKSIQLAELPLVLGASSAHQALAELKTLAA